MIYLIIFSGWVILTLCHILFGLWLFVKSSDTDSTILKILFNDGESYNEPLGMLTLIACIPILSTIIGFIYLIVLMGEGRIKPKIFNPFIWVLQKLFATRHLLDRVSKEI